MTVTEWRKANIKISIFTVLWLWIQSLYVHEYVCVCVFCVLCTPFQCVTISTATAAFVARKEKKNAASTNVSPKNFHILMHLKLDKRDGIVKEKCGSNIIQTPMVAMTVTMFSVTMNIKVDKNKRKSSSTFIARCARRYSVCKLYDWKWFSRICFQYTTV